MTMLKLDMEDNTMKDLYCMLDKRKSVRKANGILTDDDLKIVHEALNNATSLYPDIKLIWEIVKAEETTSKIGEYEILIYSEIKDDNSHLLNIGYLFEQVDLLLEMNNIGVCWLGLPRPNEKIKDGLKYIIMLGISKIKSNDLRSNLDEFKRKDFNKLWSGDFNLDVALKSSLAPSACNSQSWLVDASQGVLRVFRNKKVITIIPKSRLAFYNTIDLGIFLCFLEVALLHNEYSFNRELFLKDEDSKKLLVAEYKIKK